MTGPGQDEWYDREGCLGYAAGFARFGVTAMGGVGFYQLLVKGVGVWSRRRHAYWETWESALLFAALIAGGVALLWIAVRLLPPRDRPR